MTEYAEILSQVGQEIKPGMLDTTTPLRLGQVSSIAGIVNRPPTVTLGEGEMAMSIRLGIDPMSVAPGDTVAWIPWDGAPLIVARLPQVGTRHFDQLAFEPTHLVGASGEPAFQNSWVNFAAGYHDVGFWKQSDGWVHLTGLAKSGSSATAVIFTLPVGYRPPIEVYYTGISPLGAAELVVRTNGNVECFIGGSTTWTSLDGFMFPTVWNQSQWITPEWDNNWIGESTFGGDFVYVWTRDDGLSYITGRMLASASGGGFLVMPERARVDREGVLLQGLALGISRYELGRPANGAWLTYSSGGLSNTHYVGGMTWFSQAGRHLNSRWIDLPFATNWANFDTGASGTRTFQQCQYMKDQHGVVWLRGLAARSAATNPIATLPVGFRPIAATTYSVIADTNAQGRIDAAANGNINQLAGGAWINLTGVHFRAEQ